MKNRIPYLRKEKIMELLSSKDVITIDEIQNSIPDISTSSIRRDLKTLESEGRVVLLSGGAVRSANENLDLPIVEKSYHNKNEKNVIAEMAAELVDEGDTIFIDSGTSCTAFASKLLNRNITIVTTNTSLTTLKFAKAQVMLLGGISSYERSSVYGPVTEKNMTQFYFSKAFIGTSGLDVNKGATTANIFESNVKRLAHEASKTTYVLCDSSKFGRIFANSAFLLQDIIVISDKWDDSIGNVVPMITPDQ